MYVEIRHRCSPKYTMLLRIQSLSAAAAVFLSSVYFFIEGIEAAFILSAALCVILCVMAAVVPCSVGRISYFRSGGSLMIQKGLIVRRTVIINRSDVRYTSISSGPLERRLGICAVTFCTGGSNFRIRGVALEDGRIIDSAMSERN